MVIRSGLARSTVGKPITGRATASPAALARRCRRVGAVQVNPCAAVRCFTGVPPYCSLSGHYDATTGDDGFAGDEAVAVARQKAHDLGDIVRLSDTPERSVLLKIGKNSK